jgi:hypothetical protein
MASVVTHSPKKSAWAALLVARRYLTQRSFPRFRKKHLNLGDYAYDSYDQVVNHPQPVDALICGSDQIWNPVFTQYLPDEKMSWLSFWHDSIRRIAYAGSFAVDSLPEETNRRLSVYARRFHSLSVREESGIKVMEDIGRSDAKWVPDPTMLLSPSNYLDIINEGDCRSSDRPVAMFLGWENDVTKNAVECINKISGQNCYSLFPNSFAWLLGGARKGPGQWLAIIAKASFVITNSFHGLMFSLLFHRPFIVLLWGGAESSKNIRVLSILDKVGLAHRTVANIEKTQMESLYRQPIDWVKVDAKLNEFREVGVKFLESALV